MDTEHERLPAIFAGILIVQLVVILGLYFLGVHFA